VGRVDPTERAEAAFGLARALWESGQNRAAARRLAAEARRLYATASSQRDVSSVDNWLGTHDAT
jgi:hypothetical protein